MNENALHHGQIAPRFLQLASSLLFLGSVLAIFLHQNLAAAVMDIAAVGLLLTSVLDGAAGNGAAWTCARWRRK